ncbi:hypothetical protein [Kitasatospora sp. NPDC097643]|uniref:hypothetical protein n=1 Tax=Kitasatospora sp. NPDC097643 TaxID=3157230 RepID=UPI003326E165
MLSKRLVSTATICLLLAAGTAACGDNKDKETAAAPAPTTAATSAASTPTATPTPTPTVAKLDTDKLTAQEIEKQAKDALAAATAVKIVADMKTEEGKLSFNLALDRKGQCQGTMAMPGMGSFDIISDGKQAYIKPDAQVWKTFGGPKGDAIAELFKGRWLTGFQDDAKMKGLTSSCNLADMSKEMMADDTPSTASKGTAGTVNGVKTFSLKEKDENGEESLLHIATEGKFYPVRMEKTTGKETGQVDFTDFDKPLTLQLPSPDNIVDYSKFQTQLKSA